MKNAKPGLSNPWANSLHCVICTLLQGPSFVSVRPWQYEDIYKTQGSPLKQSPQFITKETPSHRQTQTNPRTQSHTHPAATMSLKNILNDERPLPPIRYINYPPTPPMYYYQPQAQAQAQVQVQPQVVHAAAPPPPPPSAMMQVPPPPPSHVHSYAPPSLPQSPPLYQPQTVPIVNVNLNNAHNKKRKKYMCDCGRSFTTSGHLARHMRIHTGEKNYQCPYEGCTSRFSRQDNCMQHYRTHLGTSRNSMMRRKSGTVSPPPGQVSKPKQEKAVERKMSNFLSTVLVT